MRRTSGWIGWALCLCASLTVSAPDHHEDDEVILDLIREDGTPPETGAEPAAELLRCNKVITILSAVEVQEVLRSVTRVKVPILCFLRSKFYLTLQKY